MPYQREKTPNMIGCLAGGSDGGNIIIGKK